MGKKKSKDIDIVTKSRIPSVTGMQELSDILSKELSRSIDNAMADSISEYIKEENEKIKQQNAERKRR